MYEEHNPGMMMGSKQSSRIARLSGAPQRDTGDGHEMKRVADTATKRKS